LESSLGGSPLEKNGADLRAALSDPAVFLFADGAMIAESHIWEYPFVAWIEEGDLTDEDILALIRRVQRPSCCSNASLAEEALHVLVSLTTGTASELLLAHLLVNSLVLRRQFPLVIAQDIELALHEAISNALLHGNLQVVGMKALNIGAIDQFARDVAQRLADPKLAARRILIDCIINEGKLSVCVTDQGAGYAENPNANKGASGRGLDLIRAIAETLAISDQGRCIQMRFQL
jgi:anti-sigma regulatory factor (Ser/Thr protein kinase)